MSAKDDLAPAGTKAPEVVDPFNAPVLFVDWIVTGGISENVVNMTLGTVDHSLRRSDDELARVLVATRLRCSREFALRLYHALGSLIGVQPQPADAGQNQAPPRTPSNLIN